MDELLFLKAFSGKAERERKSKAGVG